MGMNRKAVFFSLAALLILGILFASAEQTIKRDTSQHTRTYLQEVTRDTQLIETRMLPSLIRAKSYEVFSILANKTYQSCPNPNSCSAPFSTTEEVIAAYKSCMITGACQGREAFASADASFSDYAAKVKEYQQYTGANFTLEDIVSVQQTGPFVITVIAEFTVYLKEDATKVTYNKTVQVPVDVPIFGLLDPLASQELPAPRFVRRSAGEELGDAGQYIPAPKNVWDNPDTARVQNAAVQGLYREDELGPSYLQRLTKPVLSTRTYAPDGFGIHSLVPLGTTYTSSVDYETNYVDADTCFARMKLASPPQYLASTPYVYFRSTHAAQYNLIQDALKGASFITYDC